MHIKRITIQGFKTYKNETIVANLSPHHNVVTGRNGSGKSNFFSAIRFVLSDDFSRLSSQDRKALLHESSTPTLFAYVEIVFDNSDRRIPTPADEVKVKRSIGFKKDDYSLNDQSMTRSEIMSHLSVAGFSKSNPYYIVPQGRVAALTNAKDSERLQLLKEVAGAGVFETKLKDSQKEMNITAQKQDQIRSMLDDIDQRLNDLSIEREEYKQFDTLNRDRKMIEWTIRDREIKAIQHQIEKIEDDDIAADDDDISKIALQVQKREKVIVKSQKDLLHRQDTKKLLQVEIDQMEKEKSQLVSSLANLKAQFSILETESTHDSRITQNQLKSIEVEIEGKKNLLSALTPKIKKLTSELMSVSNEIQLANEKQMSLISKKSQASEFQDQNERDQWIDLQIEKLQQSKSQKRAQLKRTMLQVREIASQIEELNVRKAQSTEPFSELDENIRVIDEQYLQLKAESRALVDKRSQKWREESRQNALIQQHTETLLRSEQDLHGSMDGSISKGIDLVNSIAEKLGQKDKVYGCLGELITISEKYKTAAEVIAGNSLFHMVVANEQVAELIIKELTKNKGGRITFIPLNKIHTANYTYPQGSSFVPLYKKISPIGDEATKKALWPAVMHVFGKALVCMNLDVGSEVVREHNFDAITLDGDRIDRNGVLSGGFRSNKASKVEFLAEISKLKHQIAENKAEIDSIKDMIKSLDISIIKKNSEMNTKKTELEHLINSRSAIKNATNTIAIDLSRLVEEQSVHDKFTSELKLQLETIDARIEAFNKQRKTRFSQSTLTEEENNELTTLIETIPILEKRKLGIQQQLDDLELEQSTFNSLITEKLIPSYNDLSLRCSSSIHDTSTYEIDDIKQQITALESKLLTLNSELQEYQSHVSETDVEIKSIQVEIDELDAKQAESIELFDELSKESDRGMVKKTRLRNIQREKEKIIGELGALPENTRLTYQDESTSSLTSKLASVNRELKSLSHVNKKALDQYRRFNDQKVDLEKKLEELDQSKESIEHLMKVLEKRKNEAIIRSFKTVSIGFAKVFEKLVPEGRGRLVIMKKKNVMPGNTFSLSQVPPQATTQSDDDERNDDEEDADEENDKMNQEEEHDEHDNSDLEMKSFVGVSISVSFNSKHNEQQRIKQLSGGQKTLCALALIFAIQKADPAPFYLFDEIDANLDTQYRTAVANLVHELSRDAQFICTTFRPEQLKVCDKFYGVMFKNKTSTISEIDQETALGFVESVKD